MPKSILLITFLSLLLFSACSGVRKEINTTSSGGSQDVIMSGSVAPRALDSVRN